MNFAVIKAIIEAHVNERMTYHVRVMVSSGAFLSILFINLWNFFFRILNELQNRNEVDWIHTLEILDLRRCKM